MHCPICRPNNSQPLQSKLTKLKVEVDACPHCGGIWLDDGEIFAFSKHPDKLQSELTRALPHAVADQKLCPKDQTRLQVLKLYPGTAQQLIVDRCPKCAGFWFDAGELKSFWQERHESFATMKPLKRFGAVAGKLLPLPNLFLRSLVTIVGLYGMLGLMLLISVELELLHENLALTVGISLAALQFLLGPWLTDLSLRWFYQMSWTELNDLPPHLSAFLTAKCRQLKIKIPRLGLIDDGGPNAFTYGHHPGNARIILTRGMTKLLSERELEAVVAHELGHIVHWDMLLMTLAQMVPLVLYYIYKSAMRLARRPGRRRNKGAGQAAMIGLVAYLLYWIAQYLVLWFSRTREYHADRFAGQLTQSPNDLTSALIKIGYGLAGRQKESTHESENRKPTLEAIGALGVFDTKAAYSLALTGSNTLAAQAVEAMKWDLWNPWALFYELNSTHPLVAKRLLHLGNQAESLGQAPLLQFRAEKPESYWDEFLVELGILYLPLLLPLVTVPWASQQAIPSAWGVTVLLAGVGGLLQTRFRYRANLFPKMSIASLLKQLKVSSIRPIPCRLQGTIIGRGVPGLIWSEDFVLQDESGLIFLDYRQPLRIWEFFFGLMRGRELQGVEATIVGWYRRAPIPYIEMKSMTTNGETRTCYTYLMQLIFWIAVISGGVVLLFTKV